MFSNNFIVCYEYTNFWSLDFPCIISGVLERSQSASDQSDEEEPGGAAERWARVIDLPGFEDNVSASNYIRILFRFVAGEVAIHLARSSDYVDKPYLMLRAEKLCVDAAHMQYGPALQASLHRIQLVDKLHKGMHTRHFVFLSCTSRSHSKINSGYYEKDKSKKQRTLSVQFLFESNYRLS